MHEIHRTKCGAGNCCIVSNGKDAVLVDTASGAGHEDALWLPGRGA